MFLPCAATASSRFRQCVLRARARLRLCQRRMRRDHRRHEPRAILLEERVGLRIGVGSVLDRIHAGFECRLDAVLAVRMRRDLAAEHVRGVDDRLHLVREHLLVEPAGDVAVHAARGRELDDVGALRDLLAHRSAAIVSAVAVVGRALAHDLRDVAVGVVRAVAVTASDRDAASRRHDRRPGDCAGEDRVAQRRDAADFGAEVAHCREACFQRAPCIADADEQIVFDVAIVLLQSRTHLVVVVEDVHVHVDQARQYELLAQIDEPCAAFRRDQAVADGFDTTVAHDDRRRAARGLTGTIEQSAGVDVHGGCARLRTAWRTRQQGHCGGDRDRGCELHRSSDCGMTRKSAARRSRSLGGLLST